MQPFSAPKKVKVPYLLKIWNSQDKRKKTNFDVIESLESLILKIIRATFESWFIRRQARIPPEGLVEEKSCPSVAKQRDNRIQLTDTPRCASFSGNFMQEVVCLVRSKSAALWGLLLELFPRSRGPRRWRRESSFLFSPLSRKKKGDFCLIASRYCSTDDVSERIMKTEVAAPGGEVRDYAASGKEDRKVDLVNKRSVTQAYNRTR